MLTSLLTALFLAQAPAARPAPAAAPRPATRPSPTAADNQRAERQRIIDQRKARAARGTANRNRAYSQMRAATATPPPAAFDPRNQALMQQNQALQGIANASQLQAEAAAAQYRLNSQRAGVPQVFVPGQGMVPYQYGIATPAPAYPTANGGVAPYSGPIIAPVPVYSGR